MEKTELAGQMREHMRQQKHLRDLLRREGKSKLEIEPLDTLTDDAITYMGDDEIISGYLNNNELCPRPIEGDDLAISIKSSNDMLNFFEVINKFSVAIRDRESKNAWQAAKDKHGDKIPIYIIFIGHYYDPKDKIRNDAFCRVTIAVTDLRTNEVVFKREYWKHKCKLSIEQLQKKIEKQIKKYKKEGKTIMGDSPQPLEKCTCGCGDYTIHFLTLSDFLKCIELSGDKKGDSDGIGRKRS